MDTNVTARPMTAKIIGTGVSRDWQIVQAGIDRTARDGRTLSDHFPVTAVLRAGPQPNFPSGTTP